MDSQLNINDCRLILSSELRQLVKGKSKPSHAAAVVNVIGKLFTSYRLEMDYYKQAGQKLPERNKFLPIPTQRK